MLSILSMASVWRGSCSCQVPTVPLEAVCLKQHVRSIPREARALRLAVSRLWSHISVCVMHFNHVKAWSIVQRTPTLETAYEYDWMSTRNTQGERVWEPVMSKNVCCSDWLSEIHLKLWMNCEVTISRLQPESSVRLTIEDNVIHLSSSSWLFLVLPHYLARKHVRHSIPSSLFLLYTYLRCCFPYLSFSPSYFDVCKEPYAIHQALTYLTFHRTSPQNHFLSVC